LKFKFGHTNKKYDPSTLEKTIRSAIKIFPATIVTGPRQWEWYSGRQKIRVKMGGFAGEISFEGEVGPFMPLICAGEVLHTGKGTGFGLGKYGIVR
jgi:hypothetical protein